MGLRESAFNRARASGLRGWDAYDAIDDEQPPSSGGDSISVEEFLSKVGEQPAKASPTVHADIGEPVSAPPPKPGPPPPMPPPDMPRPAPAHQAPVEPAESSADRMAQAFERQNQASKWRGVSDALYAATAAVPLQSSQTPDFGSQEAALEKARAGDKSELMKQAMGDPRSAESMRARALLEGTGIGQTMKQRLGPRWEQLTASSLPEVGEIIRAEAAKKEGGQGGGGMTAYQRWQVEHTTGKEQAEAQQLEADRQKLSQLLGVDVSGLSRQAIDDLMQGQHTRATERLAQGQFAIARSNEQRKASEFGAQSRPIPYANGSLVYAGGGVPPDEYVKEAQKISAGYGAALAAMDDLESALAEWAQNPSMDARNSVAPRVQIAATALNTALGQGAMAENERAAIMDALGADIASPTGIAALVRGVLTGDGAAAAAMTQRLRGAKSTTDATARAKAKAYGFQFQPNGGGRLSRDAAGNVYVEE